MSQPNGYYDTLNHDLLNRLPTDARRVLELGCGAGALARAYRPRNPGAHYTGVEKVAAQAELASGACDALATGDIESVACLDALDAIRTHRSLGP